MAAVPPPAPQAVRPIPPKSVRSTATGIEDQVRNAYFVPDPTSYSPQNMYSQNLVEPKRLGRISSSTAPSPLDHQAKTKIHVPGPGAYATHETRDFALPEGGRVNRHPPVERFKPFDEYPKPDPATYGCPNDPSRPRQVMGQFSKEKRVSRYIQDVVDRTKGVPGPGAHDVLEAMEAAKPFLPEGGRVLMQTKQAGYFETAPHLTEHNPPPDAYDLPSTLKTNTGVGKLVFRYESATIQETKDMVHRLATSEQPAPGTYNVPDPEPLGSVPTLKGRMLPHAMPHPFAYNCQPDYAGKYTIQPGVLQRNSAEQIFGNGVKKGARISKEPARSSRPSSGEHVQDKELPPSVGPLAAEQPEAQVEWKAGGFASLRRVKSAARCTKQEHPMVSIAAKAYPRLQKRHRSSSQFLPMTAKRYDSISTHAQSDECSRLATGKWHLGALASGIGKATASALEPLDVDRLKREAMRGLTDKAKERMRLEGVSTAQQQVILEEMRSVMEEQVNHRVVSQETQDTAAPSLGEGDDLGDEAIGQTSGEAGGLEGPSTDTATDQVITSQEL